MLRSGVIFCLCLLHGLPVRGLAQVAGLNKLPGAFVETTATGQVVTVSSNTVKFDDSAMRLLTGEKQLQKLGCWSPPSRMRGWPASGLPGLWCCCRSQVLAASPTPLPG